MRHAWLAVSLVTCLAPLAKAQTPIKPRVLVVFGTSDSMKNELMSNASTGADGSSYLKTPYGLERGSSIDPRFAYGVGFSSPPNTCSSSPTFRGDESRMYAAKQALSNVVGASSDVAWGLARYAGNYCNISTTPTNVALGLLTCATNNDCQEDCCAASVGQAQSCSNGAAGTGPRACRCDSVIDCPTGYVCTSIGGRNHTTCVKVDHCDDNNDCAAGQSCNLSNPRRCTCTSDDNCRDNEFCIGGVCLYDPNLCRFDGYGSTDRRGTKGVRPNSSCTDKDESLPTSYFGHCGDEATGTGLGSDECGSLYVCTENDQCESNSCAAVGAGVLANTSVSACTCTSDAQCDNLPPVADGQTPQGFGCVNGFCTYTQGSCSGDGAVRIVDPRDPNVPNFLEWLNGREDYSGTSGPFLSAGNPVATINVADPELRAAGPTPVGGSLRSAASWYRSIKIAGSDPQLACRPYVTVILTDGGDTCEKDRTFDVGGNCTNCADTEFVWGPAAGALKFRQETIANARIENKVYVIGLSVSLQADKDRLNAVASAGGTGLAKFVSSSAEIEAVLADIVAETSDPPPGPAETCNDADDDCDGVVDDFDEACPAVPGQCDPGTHHCSAGMFGTCTGIVNGVPEVCNGVDDDCDGTPDDEPEDAWLDDECCPTGNMVDCCKLGNVHCVDGAPVCEGEVLRGEEVCDGVDNDCDEVVDDVEELGEPCTDGDVLTGGACTAEYVCAGTPGAGPKGLRCQQTIAPSDEVCNGIDDDCNGEPDDAADDCPAGFQCEQGDCVVSDACAETLCDPGLICELDDAGNAGCVDPCENVDCTGGARCDMGDCIVADCKVEGCPKGQICVDGSDGPECVPASDPCAARECADDQQCSATGECVPACEEVCGEGTVCVDGTCQSEQTDEGAGSDGGCDCSVAGRSANRLSLLLAGLAVVVARARRRRRD